MRKWLHAFDAEVTAAVRGWPDWVHPVMLIVTTVGQPVVTIGLAMMIAATGWLKGNARIVVAAAVAMATLGLGTLIKWTLQRERPLTEYAEAMRYVTFSFPSGHTLGATVVFGLLAYLAWQALPQPWGIAAVVALAVLIILVGISRVYLGAHYPSDVVAGWVLGLLALAVIIFIVRPRL